MIKIAKTLLVAWMFAVVWGAVVYAPKAAGGLGEASRVIYFHVPCAWLAVLAFLTSLVYSVKVLKSRSADHDIRAEVSARIGLWFCVLATISGAAFAKLMWHAWWNWDPRETSIVVLMLVYLAYFGLRSAVPDPDRKIRASAVYSILACCVMPFLIFVVPRVYLSLHPDPIINTDRQGGMDPTMRMVFFSSMIGFTGIFIWLNDLSIRIERLVRRKEGWDV